MATLTVLVVTTTACFLSGYVSDNTDCDDNNPGIHTGCVVIPAAALNFNAPPAQFVDITNTNVGKFRNTDFTIEFNLKTTQSDLYFK